ncbi:MAG: septum formation protein Maf [Parachlamydiaceae bacterium]|nr:septum formation protein Maf [Parachlamydiaceae bacterium]
MLLILGSQSPRRAEIMGYFSLPFEQMNSGFDEESVHFNGDSKAYVTELSESKAEVLAAKYPERPILTADTVVYRNGKIYNKPQDELEAIAMLNELAGGWHSVFTGVSLRLGNKHFSKVGETQVLFNFLTKDEIQKYNSSLHLYDKAGSYQLQGAGGIIVKEVKGCYYNVVGLPINVVRELLNEIGIDLWNYLK